MRKIGLPTGRKAPPVSLFPLRCAFAGALLAACGGSDAPAADASSPEDASAELDAARDTSPADAGTRDGSAPSDACTGSCAPDASGDAASGDAATATDAEAPLVFVPSYGPCPAPLSCDPLMAVIARPLILAAYPDAPTDVSACVLPDQAIPVVPACYEEGPCEIRGQVGICLGRKPPETRTGYCLKPCR
jgi:hypothetical protein